MPDTENEVQGNDVQQELMDMIIADESPATISDRIKDMLFAKSADRVDNFKPAVLLMLLVMKLQMQLMMLLLI